MYSDKDKANTTNNIEEFNFQIKPQPSETELKSSPTKSDNSELPKLAFEDSDEDSFETDSWIDDEELNEQESTPFIGGPSIADLVINPESMDIVMTNEVPPLTTDFIDRKMSQMTEMRG